MNNLKNNLWQKKLSLLILFLLMLSFTSCVIPEDYEFINDTSEIIQVDVVDIGVSNSNDVTIRASYPVYDIDAFLSDFQKVDCSSSNHISDIGNCRAFRITYANGEYEIISADGAHRYKKEIGHIQGTFHFFDNEQFVALVEKYSPPRDSGDVTEYNFMYPENEITKIELVDKRFNYNLDFPIDEVELYPVSDTETFLSDFREMECRTGGWAKWNESRDTIKRIIKVSYKSGEYEYISADGYLQHRHEYVFGLVTNYLSGTDCKCFNKEQFDELIRKYSP